MDDTWVNEAELEMARVQVALNSVKRKELRRLSVDEATDRLIGALKAHDVFVPIELVRQFAEVATDPGGHCGILFGRSGTSVAVAPSPRWPSTTSIGRTKTIQCGLRSRNDSTRRTSPDTAMRSD